jgi:AcrR family transcriptional regulator
MAVGNVEPGLRERKKVRTRETIARAALALFEERGFQGTTLPAIAEAADVSPRTVSSYFPAKELLVFLDAERELAEFTAFLQHRAPGEGTFDALRGWLDVHLADLEQTAAERAARWRIVEADESLRAYERTLLARFERVIVEALAQDMGTDPGALGPRLAGAAARATFQTIGRWAGEQGAAPSRERAEALIDQGLAFLRAGVRALREGDPPTA